jgi:putative flippase GtrA
MSQPVRFLVVGSAGYGVNLVAFASLVALGFPYAAASVAAYLGANALMYLGNRTFTFRLGRRGLLAAYPRYLLVGLAVAALTAGLLAAQVEGFRVEPRVGQAVAFLAVTPVSFVLIKRWTFRLATV